DRRFEIGERLIAIAELVIELRALDAGLGLAVRRQRADLRQLIPIGERRLARRLGAGRVARGLVRVGELAAQLGAPVDLLDALRLLRLRGGVGDGDAALEQRDRL